MEKVIEVKSCKNCQSEIQITQWDIEFLEKMSQKFGDTVVKMPQGNFCHHCKEQRKMAFRNERNLYHRKCDYSGKEIISVISPDKKFKVYDFNIWWSDKWDPMDYGIDYDENRSFFDQFNELYTNTPKFSLFQKNCENSPYSHLESDQKDCYMTTGGHWSENCRYMMYGVKSSNTQDVFWAFECDNCYEIVNSYKLSKCQFMQYSENCHNCMFGFYVKSCNDCIGCVGLTNKKYYILNEKYTEEEYKKKLKELDLNNYSKREKFREKFEELKKNTPHKHGNFLNVENTTGTDVFNSKNIENGFLLDDCEDLKNCSVMGWGKTARDIYAGGDFEKAYEVTGTGLKSYNVSFCMLCYENTDILYCADCQNSKNLFGCVGLRNKQYCILNKQYTKEEYNALVPRIIEKMKIDGEWGEFFPASMSPYGYNETVAQEYYPVPHPSPLLGEEREYKGTSKLFQFSLSPGRGKMSVGQIKVFNWSDYESPFPKVEKTINGSDLPDEIDKIPNDILNRGIICEKSGKPFRIIEQELEFYRKLNIPAPRRHPDQRHLDRVSLRNPRKLYDRNCDKCGIGFKTTYSPERPEKIYCEKYYNNEVN